MSDRTPFVVGNWKMHKTIGETRSTLMSLRAGLQGVEGVDAGVAPPFQALATAADVLHDSGLALAAQNMHPEEEGAFTGEISPVMLRDAGVSHVIVGHSERRAEFGESDAFIAAKVGAAVEHGLRPILCVGESREQRQAEETVTVVTTQLRGGLERIDAHGADGLTIAYEPVWAVGTGETATPDQAQEVHAIIRDFLGDLMGGGIADGVRIQYGGSVKPHNAAELMACPDIDGALVGGASLEADSFAAIVEAATRP